MSIDWRVQVLNTVSSTQGYIQNHLDDLVAGDVVQAVQQTGGYGRHGREWVSPEGNLYFSFLIDTPEHFEQVAFIAGLAVAEALKPFVRVQLKWPNDVLIGGKKCAGIIIEAVGSSLIVGVGINVVDAAIEEATCLEDYNIERDVLRDDILDAFSKLYEVWTVHGFGRIRALWMEYGFRSGIAMRVKLPSGDISGAYQGVDKAGHLLLLCDTSGEVITVRSGDVFVNHVACD